MIFVVDWFLGAFLGEFLERILLLSALTIRSDPRIVCYIQFAMAWWKSGRVDISNYKEVRPTNKTYHAHAELLNEASFRWISSTNSMSRACNYTLESVTKMSSNYLMFFAYFISVFMLYHGKIAFYRQITYPSELAWACAMSHPFVSLPHLNQVRFVSSNESQRHEDSRTVFAKTMLYTIPHVMSCYVMSCHAMSCRVSCFVSRPVPYRTTPHHTTSHHITSHHIK